MLRKWFAAAAIVAVSIARGQDPKDRSLEGRLLEILTERGVITSEERSELKELEIQLRKEANLEAAVDREVEQMVVRLSEDGPKLSYKRGSGFTLKSGDGKFSLTIGARIQVRYIHSVRENENGNQNGEDLQDLSVPRARFWFKGFAFDPRLKYELQLDVAGDFSRPLNSDGTGFDSADTSTNRLTEMKEANVDWQICEDKPWFNLKAGSIKVPYSRQELTSIGRQEFVDRAPTNPVFAPARAYGVMFHGRRFGEKDDVLEYSAGLFDGVGVIGVTEGENIANNDDGLTYAGRVVVNPFGGLPYSDSDLRPCEERARFLMALGLNAWYHQDNNRSSTLGNFDDWSIGADLAMAWRGLYFEGELHHREDAQPNVRDELDVWGWHAQLGYMIVPQRFELGLRYAEVDWDGSTAITPATVPTNSASREYLIVLGYFWHEHDMKLQLDFGRAETHFAATMDGPNPANVDEWRARMQFQLQF